MSGHLGDVTRTQPSLEVVRVDEARGLLLRNTTPEDRRVRLLTLTNEGQALLDTALPSMQRAQARMLEPLPPRELDQFMRMLRQLVTANNAESRAPSET